MGFGLLFVGFILHFFPVLYLDTVMVMVGAVLVCWALNLLSEYNTPFRICYFMSFGGILLSVATALTKIAEYLHRFAPGNAYGQSLYRILNGAGGTIYHVIYAAFYLVFYVVLLYALFLIGREVGLMKIQVRSLRNLVITAAYELLTLLIALNDRIFGDITPYFNFPMYLFGLVWLALIAINIYSCYRYITVPEAEEAADQKDTFFGKALKHAAEQRHAYEENQKGANDGDYTGKNSDPARRRMEKKNDKIRSKQQKRER